MRFDILTLFPEIFTSYLGESILSKAIERNQVAVHTHNIRDWADNRHNTVDDRPFGGGPGMVMCVEPVVSCVEAVQQQDRPGHVVMLTPQGRTLDQGVVQELAGKQRILLLCGRYEGFDQRVIDILRPDEISIGDYVLNGGEVAAMAIIEAVIRLVPGVLGHEDSNREDSFSHPGGVLEFPQYTRPREFRGHAVPDVLLSGDHGAIARWRQQQSYLNTKKRRADLLDDNE